MDDPIHREYNLNIFRLISPLIKSMEYFIFFGTLLGYQREGNILEYDDDVDIFLNFQHKEDILKVLELTELTLSINTDFLIQATLKDDHVISYLDFYLYRKRESYLEEYWNFGGMDGSDSLQVPLDITLPTFDSFISDIPVKVPSKPKDCCIYLYGQQFMKPLIKNKDYKTHIVDHKPVIILEQ
jgi:hypothetical protein